MHSKQYLKNKKKINFAVSSNVKKAIGKHRLQIIHFIIPVDPYIIITSNTHKNFIDCL